MTDQEIKDQIERDARSHAAIYDKGPYREYAEDDYITGATEQDKIATNRTVDEVIEMMRLNRVNLQIVHAISGIIEELEKLRRV
jgi:hypothetical protein